MDLVIAGSHIQGLKIIELKVSITSAFRVLGSLFIIHAQVTTRYALEVPDVLTKNIY